MCKGLPVRMTAGLKSMLLSRVESRSRRASPRTLLLARSPLLLLRAESTQSRPLPSSSAAPFDSYISPALKLVAQLDKVALVDCSTLSRLLRLSVVPHPLQKMSATQTLSQQRQAEELDLGGGSSSGIHFNALTSSKPLTILSLLEQPVTFVKQRQKSRASEIPYKAINERVSDSASSHELELQLTLCSFTACPCRYRQWGRRVPRCFQARAH